MDPANYLQTATSTSKLTHSFHFVWLAWLARASLKMRLASLGAGNLFNCHLLKEHTYKTDKVSYDKKSTKAFKEKLWKVDVLIATPESFCCDEFSQLTTIEWEVVVVDEAQRIKNSEVSERSERALWQKRRVRSD